MTPRLAAERLTLGYGGAPVLHELDLAIPAGAVTAVVGPNGCGKSTLVRALGRLLAPDAGRVLLDGADLAGLDTRAVARRLAVLPQHPVAPAVITVAELVARGRYPHRGWWRPAGPADRAAVAAALARTGMGELAGAEVAHLSGGQRQRAWIAMALAQEAATLLLDEPTNHLDPAHQVDVLELVAGLVAEGGTAVVVLHDLGLAARWADELVVLEEGRVAAQGPPAEVLTEELIAGVFDLEARILHDPVSGAPVVFPVRRRR